MIGKQRTMELVLTGRRIDAKEALRLGLREHGRAQAHVARATPSSWRSVVARRPPLAVKLAKQAVLAADEMPLTAGLAHERRLYELAMATEDRVEGMQAFLEKRRPSFEGPLMPNALRPRLRRAQRAGGLLACRGDERRAEGRR